MKGLLQNFAISLFTLTYIPLDGQSPFLPKTVPSLV